MGGLIFLGIIILIMSDYFIRTAPDSKLKTIWLKVIKKSFVVQVNEAQKKLIKRLEKKYGKHPVHKVFFNYEKLIDDISKNYIYKVIYLAFAMIIIGILVSLYIYFK